MSKMAVFNTDAVVLKQFDLGEADKIITFYTEKQGKVRAVARSVRKTNSRLSGLVEPFNYNNITVYRGGSLDKINQIEGKYSFSKLREKLVPMAYATYLAEIVEKVGMENDSDPPLFSLLLSTFYKMLDLEGRELAYLSLIFKLRLLALSGFKPVLERCVDCENTVSISGNNILDIARGGIICKDCKTRSDGEHFFEFSGEVYRIINTIYDSGFEIPENLRLSGRGFRQLETMLDRFMKYHLDIKLKSEKFLFTVRDL